MPTIPPEFDRRRGKQGVENDRRVVVPLRCDGQIISYDNLRLLRYQIDLIKEKRCLGMANIMILREGLYSYGFSGSVVETPELAAGIIIARLIPDLGKQAELNSGD